MNNLHSHNSIDKSQIAIIGLSGRFPGAKDANIFWQNVRDGVESISTFSDQELEFSGVNPAMLKNPKYVRAGAVLEGIELFDAAFFGFSPREAEIMDPQHRLFLECASEAIESAGYNTETYKGAIGVYAGVTMNTYLMCNLYPNRDLFESLGTFQTALGNDKDFLPTRVSYKLNLKGPSINVQTACSTSLVAVHLACQSLLSGECDMALAGGVSVKVPQKSGYLYQEGGIRSPDGHCRAFDAKAQGTVGGEGVGIVVLKRLEDALADGDCIHAIIKGSAINNDGSLKVGYTAPSVEGQAAVISEALAIAEIEPETVTYVEAHGTGTALGDPIEIAALTQAFHTRTKAKGFCAIGSLKTNVGHLDAAAGVAGLIKTVLALKHKLLPPSLHFEEPNSKIDFANSPFYVNTSLCEWKTNGSPCRAGVSSFGIGGTNAHLILEEALSVEASSHSRPWQLLVLSAKTDSALDTATTNLVEHLKHNQLNLADVAYTLQVGRRAFNHRRILVCQNLEDAVNALETLEPTRIFTSWQESKGRPVVFMFSGQGAQYVNMGLELYQSEPTFREQVDLCSELLKPHLGLDLRHVLYPSEEDTEAALSELKQTAITQPALFVIEYALAKLWMEWGVYPQAMIGHSIGEYVAACLSGVFSLQDALALVAARGQLMQKLPSGSMLAVPLSEKEVQPFLGNQLSLAVINGPSNCVVAGSTDAVDALFNQLATQGVECRRLQTSHAFHSHMMEPVLEPFSLAVKRVKLTPPQIPYISNLTGTWITDAQATDPSYWTKHLRSSVRFASGLQQFLKEPDWILLEVGPGRTLSTLAKRHPDKVVEQVVLSSLRHPQDQKSDVAFLLTTLGKLWLAGVQVDWSGFYAHEQRYRIPLPTYPFERQRYWIDPPGIDQPIQSQSLENTESYQKVESIPLHSRPNLQNAYVAPRDGVEETIANIWQEFLGIKQVGIHDDFFELGGDSFLAVALLTKLNETLQSSLSPNTLLQAPTIATLANLIREISSQPEISDQQQEQVLPSLLVPIQRGSFKQPFFLVHPVGGHVYIYRDLARHLGWDQPVYGIQAEEIDGETDVLKVEEIAARYVKALRVLQPNGPYFLGGSSFGGMVAFEMAQQLQAIAQKVALLVLIDTPGPGQMPVLVEDDEAAILVYLLGVGINISLSLEYLRQLEPDQQLLYFLEQVKSSNRVVPPDFGLPQVRHFLHLFKVHGQAMLRYIPKSYQGRLIFFRANERDAINPQNPELPWRKLAALGIEILEVPGNHMTMHYPPHVEVLAKHLRVYLDEARRRIELV